MSVLYVVYDYLQQIKRGEISFQLLINKGLKEYSEEEAFIIKDSLKSIVNRYYFLMWEQNKIYPLDDEEVKDYFICALGQYHYVKDVNDEKLLSFFLEDTEKLPKIQSSEMINAIKTLGGSQLPISQKENDIIVKRLSINYAYPEWVVKLISKQFGIKHAYKAIASSRKNIKIALNCNTFFNTADDVLKDNANLFERGKLAANTLRYLGKEKLIDIPLFKKNQIFVEDEASQMLVEQLQLEIGDEVLLVADDKGTAALDIAMHISDVGNVHVAVKQLSEVNMIRGLASRFKLHSLDVFNSTVDVLLTHVPSNSCDKVLFIPDSTSFGLVRRKPSVLLNIKREQLDGIIQKQKADLEEISTFVKEGGTLIYAVFTYNKKESFMVISEFLNNHPEFYLDEEKQVFAYEAPSDGVYYARLKKK